MEEDMQRERCQDLRTRPAAGEALTDPATLRRWPVASAMGTSFIDISRPSWVALGAVLAGALACGPLACSPLAAQGASAVRVDSENVAGAARGNDDAREAGAAAKTAVRRSAAAPAWSWSGVLGTGQSLSVGALPVNPIVNQQHYRNLMLSLGSAGVPPFDPNHPSLAIVPLVEPLRGQGSGFPRAYPQNLWGETPHGAMAAQISALAEAAGAHHTTLHSVVGESGQGMVALRKGAAEVADKGGVTGRAYAASMFEVAAITRLAKASGNSYGVAALVMTHGETDAGNTAYEAELVQLWKDYNQDIARITGQTTTIPMIVSQHHAFGFTEGSTSGASASTLAQWQVAVHHPGDILCAGPKYQYPYLPDGVHLEVWGYELLGEKYGQVYHEAVVQGRGWRPLEPIGVERNGRVVSVRFHVPVPPLVWNDAIVAPHQVALTEWAAGRGFELRVGSTPLPIESVAIHGDVVQLTVAAEVPAGSVVGYAATSDGTRVSGLGHRWGQLQDSDPFVGVITGASQPNHAVAFELPVP
jgi:hypothetical protein